MKNHKVIIAMVVLFGMFQVGAMEMHPDMRNSALSSKQKKEFRTAIMGMRETVPQIQKFVGPLSAEQQAIMDRYNQQQEIVAHYIDQYPHDPFIENKMANHATFLRKLDKEAAASQKKLSKSRLSQSEIQVTVPECCICLDEKPTVAIPCNNNHPDRICESCLNDIMKKDMTCPICRAHLQK